MSYTVCIYPLYRPRNESSVEPILVSIRFVDVLFIRILWYITPGLIRLKAFLCFYARARAHLFTAEGDLWGSDYPCSRRNQIGLRVERVSQEIIYKRGEEVEVVLLKRRREPGNYSRLCVQSITVSLQIMEAILETRIRMYRFFTYIYIYSIVSLTNGVQGPIAKQTTTRTERNKWFFRLFFIYQVSRRIHIYTFYFQLFIYIYINFIFNCPCPEFF